MPNIDQRYAVTDFSNTLRVELAPFGVKAVTLFTGDIATKFCMQVMCREVIEICLTLLHTCYTRSMLRQ